jgi:hypothetical protein
MIHIYHIQNGLVQITPEKKSDYKAILKEITFLKEAGCVVLNGSIIVTEYLFEKISYLH